MCVYWVGWLTPSLPQPVQFPGRKVHLTLDNATPTDDVTCSVVRGGHWSSAVSLQRLKHYAAEYTSYLCICDFSSALIPTILVVVGPFRSVRKTFGARELRNRYPPPPSHLLRQRPRRVQEEGGGAVALIAGWIVLHPSCSSTVAFWTL